MKHPNYIHIGTSGWNYKHWKGRFYPEELPQKKWLSYYIERFKTVELNNSFYRLPERKTFETWNKSVPDDFVFAVKANRYITHLKRLIDSEETLNTFLKNAEGLEENLGPILFQLPPGLKFNSERLNNFVNLLPKKIQCTFEFRNPTWWNDETYEILDKFGLSFCIFQLAGSMTPKIVTSNFVYIRLHGPTNHPYQGSYSDDTLSQWAVDIKKWVSQKKKVYCYFDNDDSAYAAFNAACLRRMVGDLEEVKC